VAGFALPADFKPTGQQIEAQKALEEQLRGALSRIDVLVSEDLAAFNDMLRKSNITSIVAKAP